MGSRRAVHHSAQPRRPRAAVHEVQQPLHGPYRSGAAPPRDSSRRFSTAA